MILSDHIINLLPGVEGMVTGQKDAMLRAIDDYLSLDDADRLLYRVGRRCGFLSAPGQLDDPVYLMKAQNTAASLIEKFGGVEEGLARLLTSYI
jgi:hypothetical protein